MERKPQKIRQAGYIALPQLQELVRDALRSYSKEERLGAGRLLIREITGWCSLSDEEALGLLESAKFEFMVSAESGGHSLKKCKK